MFMARAVRYARAGDRRNTLLALILTLTIGLGFGISKIIEYNNKIDSGITLLTNEFFAYYFAFTGIHFLHFIIGVGVLGFAIAKTRSDEMNSAYVRWIEAAGCYWHMVDLLWVMLFPMIYLLRVS
jgi:nitric oxide reductase NorE protein